MINKKDNVENVEELVDEVVNLTSKIDDKFVSIIIESMDGCYSTQDQLVRLSAIVNSMSYCLGKTLAELAYISNKNNIEAIVSASGKIVNDGILDFIQGMKFSSKNIN